MIQSACPQRPRERSGLRAPAACSLPLRRAHGTAASFYLGGSESPRGPPVPFHSSARRAHGVRGFPFFSVPRFPFLLSPPIRAGGACAAGLDRAVGRCDARRFLLPDLGWLLLRREGAARGRGETSSRRRSQECGPTEKKREPAVPGGAARGTGAPARGAGAPGGVRRGP